MSRSTDSSETSNANSAQVLRPAKRGDAAAIWQLVDSCSQLDSNSCYAYLLLCTDFADTTWVADDGEQLAGFVAGYYPPTRPETLFIWQVGVAPHARGQGLALQMLLGLLKSPGGRRARAVEATITPDNEPSWRLFRALARELGCGVTDSPYFAEADFRPPSGEREDGHQAELLIHLGPIGPEKE